MKPFFRMEGRGPSTLESVLGQTQYQEEETETDLAISTRSAGEMFISSPSPCPSESSSGKNLSSSTKSSSTTGSGSRLCGKDKILGNFSLDQRTCFLTTRALALCFIIASRFLAFASRSSYSRSSASSSRLARSLVCSMTQSFAVDHFSTLLTQSHHVPRTDLQERRFHPRQQLG